MTQRSTRTNRTARRSSSTSRNLLVGYYALLGIATFLMAGYTILSGGAIAGYGHHIQQLQVERLTLEQQRQNLQKQLSQQTSLTSVATAVEESDFQDIGTPLTVSGLTSVAQAQ